MKKKIMILGGGDFQVPAIVESLKMGLDVVVCDYYEVCPGKSIPGVIPELISTYDYDGVLEAAKRHKIDAILTLCTDYPARIVAYVAEQLGLPGISLDAAVNATDKGLMRKCMEENGVPSVKYYIVSTEEEYYEAISHFEKKCVVKAVDNAGSRGIQLIHDISDKKKLAEAFEYCKPFSHSGDLVIEEFLEGPEVCVETINYKGICYPIQITDQLAKQPPFFTDAGYSQPSTIFDEATLEEIKRVTVEANKALKNDNGSSCTEIIVTKDGPKIVEVGPRLAGDYMTTHLVPLSNGVDMVKAVIQIALGQEPDLTPKFDKGSCIRFYIKPAIGTIKEIRGIEEAKAAPGVVMVHIMKNVGDTAVELRGSGDRICCVMTQCDTEKEAIECCEKALDMIEVITE